MVPPLRQLQAVGDGRGAKKFYDFQPLTGSLIFAMIRKSYPQNRDDGKKIRICPLREPVVGANRRVDPVCILIPELPA